MRVSLTLLHLLGTCASNHLRLQNLGQNLYRLSLGHPLVLNNVTFQNVRPLENSADSSQVTCPEKLDESCLFLNVFTPFPLSNNSLVPVMVFIHGGHYDQGGAGTELYDGPNFASYTGVVLVTMSYRLGALGFLVTKDLPGNNAILDQIFSLKWVRDNIK